MTWNDLLFMHWRVPVDALRPLVPPGLQIDRFDGDAWIGVIPFHMTDVRPRLLPSPFASNFPELNVRTYVRRKDKAGVWFFSLDAANRLAVWTARRFFHLPYQFAEMFTSCTDDVVRYRSRRAEAFSVELKCEYKAIGPVFHSVGGTLEHWLTERYCLFSTNSRGEIFRGDIHHEPWPLQLAEAEIEANTMTVPIGITLPLERPLLHFAKRLHVRAWLLN
jgi:uncharacterized protein YqjF (DUF2071 family)